MKHLDLFSGIGGFALAAERVWPDIIHTFVEYDPFCQAVLKKHWPEAEIHGDIRTFVAHAKSSDANGDTRELSKSNERQEKKRQTDSVFLLTGGFPCQPFSQAGRRKGTADDRYLWPPMLEAIALFRPEWVIAENVAGLVTWNDSVVLETVCLDLEREGYEVQPFIIPAVAVGAPHRRDRVWIVSHAKHDGLDGSEDRQGGATGNDRNEKRTEQVRELKGADSVWDNASNTRNERRGTWNKQRGKDERTDCGGRNRKTRATTKLSGSERRDWSQNWFKVATHLCRVDDGLPKRLDRNPRLKALGNAIVPQVAEEIMKAIKDLDKETASN